MSSPVDEVVHLKANDSAKDHRTHLFGYWLAYHALRGEVLTIVC